jgi:hypothetical protein
MTANPWYIIAAVGLCASNKPEAVPEVFQHALKELQSPASDGDTGAKQLLLARRFREALFKAGLTCGYARVRQVTWLNSHTNVLLDYQCTRCSAQGHSGRTS